MSYHFTPRDGEPWGTCCKSCRLPILPGQRREEVAFPANGESAALSGIYHAECAQPYAGLARMLAALGGVQG